MSAPRPNRRSVLLGGCVAVVAAGLQSSEATAALLPTPVSVSPDVPAPRTVCSHEGCRFWRPAGTCGLRPPERWQRR